jgi:integrase
MSDVEACSALGIPLVAIEEVIATYRPVATSAAALAFAQGAVTVARPPSVPRARALLFACTRLATWAEGVALEPSPEVLLHPSVLERFSCSELASASATLRRTARANLRTVARAHAQVVRHPDPVLIRRDNPKAPYDGRCIDAYFALAAHQSTEARRWRLTALLCLGLGAGLDGVDLRHTKGCHVAERSGGVLVDVPGPRARTVPVLAAYYEALLEAAAFAGERFICGGEQLGRKNVTANLVAKLSGGSDLPRLEVARLRSTWLAEVARRFGIGVLLGVSGLRRSSRLSDFVGGGDLLDEAVVVAMFGGAR